MDDFPIRESQQETSAGLSLNEGLTSIRSHLLLLLVAIVTLIAVLMIGAYLVDRRQDLQRAETAYLTTVQLAAADLSGLLAEHERALRAIASSPQVQSMNPSECESVLELNQVLQTRDRNVIVVDREGRSICAASELSGSVSPSRWLFSVMKGNDVQLSGAFIDGITQRKIVLMALPLRDASGVVAGAVALPIDMTRYQLQLRSVLASESMVAVLGSDGGIIARSRERGGVRGSSVLRGEVVETARRDGQGTLMARGVDRVERLFAFATVPRFGWMVFAVVPTDMILGPVRGWARLDAALWGVVLALVALLTLSTAKRIAGPIQNLAAVARSIGHGQSAQRAPVEGPGEVQLVARQFNAMVDRLEAAVESERRLFEEIRALSGRVLEAQEQERKRISREIHDDLGQKLAALRMDLASGVSNLSDSSLRERSERMIEVVDSTIQSVRRIALELRPAMLDDLGLVPAVEREVRQFEQRTGIACNMSIRPPEFSVAGEQSTAVFRILQETLTNVARHSSATEVDIRLWRDDEGVLLQVRDNGVGLINSKPKGRKGLGLIGMRERATMLGGTVSIEGAEGEGTVVTVRLPAEERVAV